MELTFWVLYKWMFFIKILVNIHIMEIDQYCLQYVCIRNQLSKDKNTIYNIFECAIINLIEDNNTVKRRVNCSTISREKMHMLKAFFNKTWLKTTSE